MKAFLNPTGLHSRAMLRVANALAMYAPSNVEVVQRAQDADFVVVHAIGPGLFHNLDENQPHAIMQYCMKTAGHSVQEWLEMWRRAKLVWSYYDLSQYGNGFEFYYAPLGIDHAFTAPRMPKAQRPIGAISSGFVSAPIAEAISEVAWAAALCGKSVVHLGPYDVVGMEQKPKAWKAAFGVSDFELAELYASAEYVSGLRHCEGFEMPVIEGLACGARPVVFDRPEMREWYEDHAVFVEECYGNELVGKLAQVFKNAPKPVSFEERSRVLEKFNWEKLVTAFWRRLKL